jgi:hypothetical protein
LNYADPSCLLISRLSRALWLWCSATLDPGASDFNDLILDI